jgi:hypothetical protein
MSSIAVFLVLGGATAIAANQLAKNSVGKKQLKPNSVTTAKIKKNAVTTAKIKNNAVNGAKVNEATLGTVPSAAVANSANSANSLVTMSALKQTKVSSSASGASPAVAAAAATAVTLYEDSHFRLYGKCFVDTTGPTLFATTYIATKQDGAIFDAVFDELSGSGAGGYLNVATAEDLREVYGQSVASNTAFIAEAADFGATAADGYSLFGILQVAAKSGAITGGDGLYGAGNVCLFTGYTNHS